MRKDFGSVKDDLTGKTFGYLLVLERAPNRFKPNGKARTMWKCQCSYNGIYCKHFSEVDGSSLKKGHTTSCGCFNREKVIKAHTMHGLSKNPLVVRFMAMLDRCHNEKNAAYKSYGGRGIFVYEEWKNPTDGPTKFVAYIESICPNVYELLQKGCQIDRIDNNKGYQPDNIRIVDRHTNMNNTRAISKYKVFGEWLTPKEAMRKYRKDMTWSCLKYRMNTGWDIERALIIPIMKGWGFKPDNYNQPLTEVERLKYLAG